MEKYPYIVKIEDHSDGLKVKWLFTKFLFYDMFGTSAAKSFENERFKMVESYDEGITLYCFRDEEDALMFKMAL